MLIASRPFMVEVVHRGGGQPSDCVAGEFGKVRRHYDQLAIGERAEIEFFGGLPHNPRLEHVPVPVPAFAVAQRKRIRSRSLVYRNRSLLRRLSQLLEYPDKISRLVMGVQSARVG